MDPNSKPDRLLHEWDTVARTARRPAAAPRQRGIAGVGSTLGLAGAGLLAAALVVAVTWLGGRISTVPDVGSDGSPVASAEPTATPMGPPSAVTTSPAPVALQTCLDAQAIGDLDLRITSWEGAAGSRIANVSLANNGDRPCVLAPIGFPELFDGRGVLLAAPKAGGSSPVLSMSIAAGETVTTLVSVSNVCVDAVTPPITIAFGEGDGRLVATPLSASDTTVPPCNGPNQPASIQMQPWSRS